MKKIALIGWRGLVGSVLVERLMTQAIWKAADWYLCSTSQAGQRVQIGAQWVDLHDAYDLEFLQQMEIIITCQGSDYTQVVYPALRKLGWQGYFLDAASHLRYADDSVLVLDPINLAAIERAMDAGVKTFVGANCTVSLLLLAIAGLVREGVVESVITASYQALSGAGAEALHQLGRQLQSVGQELQQLPEALSTLDWLKALTQRQQHAHQEILFANNVVPWIGSALANGQTQEEWKANVEANKILSPQSIEMDGLCVRVDALRCHSQAVNIQLKKNISIADCETLIAHAHPWVKVIANEYSETTRWLTPTAVAGTLDIRVGRLRKLNVGKNRVSLFTTGDQLLWGAAEPLLRTLNILVGQSNETN